MTAIAPVEMPMNRVVRMDISYGSSPALTQQKENRRDAETQETRPFENDLRSQTGCPHARTATDGRETENRDVLYVCGEP